MIGIEARTRVPAFADITAVRKAQQAKRNQLEADLYPRDGSRELFQLEKDMAGKLGVKPGHLLLYNTGMSAVVDALEASRPTAGTRILRGQQHYSQAGNYIADELRSRGATVVETDPGSIADIDKALQRKRPDIVFFETVTNGSEMAVLDLEQFLRLPVLQEIDPLIILDNTLPSSEVPLGQILAVTDRRVIGVESATKYFGLNNEMGGIAYTFDNDLLLRLRKRRQRTGSLLSASAAETIRECMPRTAQDYQARNRAIFEHTLRLAIACFKSEGDQEVFRVVHPNLPDHPNSVYVNSHAPYGISPVFFIQPASLEERHYEIAQALWQDPVISRLCDLGQSFGFDRVRIWPDDNTPVVRISGGRYSEGQRSALDQAFSRVLSAFR